MGLLERVQEQHRGLRFKAGPGVVDPHESRWGHDAEATFRPEAYGDYLATSNAVYSCVTLRADLLSTVPLRFWKGRGSERTEVATGPLPDLFRKVNPYWTWERLLYMSEATLGLWGECFWTFERGPNGMGVPREIWWVKPTDMTVVPHPEKYIAGFVYKPKNGSEPIPFKASEVLWLRYPNPLDQFSGLAPMAAARLAADLEGASAKSNRNLFANGVQLGGAVFPKDENTTYTLEQVRELEELLDKRFRGVDKAHKWAVFRTAMQMQPVGINPKDAEFLGTLGYSLDAVARAYRIPVEVINGPGKSYINFPTALRALWQLAIQPEAGFIATEITEQVLPMFRNTADVAEFDFTDVEALRDDEMPLWDRVANAWDKGLLGRKTAHQMLKVEPVEDDEYKLALNMTLHDEGEQPTPSLNGNGSKPQPPVAV